MGGVWLSCDKFTVSVEVDEHGIITEAAPIVRKFIGQDIKTLGKWMSRFEGFKFDALQDYEED